MQITRFPPSQQYGSSHGGSTMRESSLKHICDSIFCPSAMRNPQRRDHVSRRPAARPRRSPQICSAVFLLDGNFYFFHNNVISSTAQAQLPAPLKISVVVLLPPACMQRCVSNTPTECKQPNNQSTQTEVTGGGPEAELLCQIADTLKAKADV